MPPADFSFRALLLRTTVFGLAFFSFACLLGQFYGLWTMRWFGQWFLPPAGLALIGIAWRTRCRPAGPNSPAFWIINGAVGGLLAAFSYDLYRLPFVLAGAHLFDVFPRFGQLLLGVSAPSWAVESTGWAYHFSNGAALGIMFFAMMIRPTPKRLLWGAVAWALFVETVLLLTPYARFFGLKIEGRFLFLTASAHLIFGLALGVFARRQFAVAAMEPTEPA